jgi:uncharacterized repeat protein (TIGR02543 family)
MSTTVAPSPPPTHALPTDHLRGWYTFSAFPSGAWNPIYYQTGYRWTFGTDLVSSNTRLYAHFTAPPRTIPVHFDPNGGQLNHATPINVPDDEGVMHQPANPTWQHHVFHGWYTDRYAGYQWDFSTLVTGTFTLYARWDAYLTLRFNLNNETEQQTRRLPRNSLLADVPSTPDTDTYYFMGWYTDNGTWTNRWNLANTPFTADTDLYARWGTFSTASFYGFGGSPVPDPITHLRNGATIELPHVTPGRTYYTFRGWYTNHGVRWIFAPNEGAMPVTEPMTLYARWQAYLTISLHYADGNLHQSRRVPAGVLLTNPPVLSDTNTQYFAGWFATGAENAWDFTTTAFTQNTRLDARFNNLHRVQFYNNEGEVETTLYLRSGVAINENYAPSLSPPIGNYEFGGWRIGNAQGERWYFAPATNATLVTGNVSLHPRWYGLHRLTFETGLMGQAEYYRILREGDLLGVAPEDPQLNGSSERFMGWFRDRTFQRMWDIANDRMPGHDITVYARWGGFVSGELGPSGGVIFYSRAYNNPFTLFRHVGDTGVYAWYLEAAPEPMGMYQLVSFAYRLYPLQSAGTLDLSPVGHRGIGHGMKNTDFWYNLTSYGVNGVRSPAAEAARAFDGGGWFIPSVNEIEHLIGVSPPDHRIRQNRWTTSTWFYSGGEYRNLNSFQVQPGGGIADLWSGNTNTYVWPARAW